MVGIGFKGKEVAGLKSDKLNLWDALTTLNHLQNFQGVYYGLEEEDLTNEDDVVEFVACGKNEVLDADMNYSLEQDTFAKPIQEEEFKEGELQALPATEQNEGEAVPVEEDGQIIEKTMP